MHTLLPRLLPLLGLALASCLAAPKPIEPLPERFDAPDPALELEVRVGQPVLRQGLVHTLPALDLDNAIHSGDGWFLIRRGLEPQRLVARTQTDEWVFYEAERITSGDPLHGQSASEGGLAISRADPAKRVVYHHWTDLAFAPKPEPLLREARARVEGLENSVRELVYEGLDGALVQLTYREFGLDERRPLISQTRGFELGPERVLELRGARIQVLDASPSVLRCRVLTGFESPASAASGN